MTTKEILFIALEAYCKNTSGECKSSFFETWFTQNGKTYNFIFKQNLFVTNIQFRELIDLLQINIINDTDSRQINFMNTNEFTNLAANIISSFIDEKELKEIRNNNSDSISQKIIDRIDLMCDNYIDLFENTIVIDAYYTSCIVSVPKSLNIDIKNICYQSGYIHSCGENIYTRNMDKAKYYNFSEKLKEYLKNDNRVLNFIMYTHEDYPLKNELYANDFQKHGLDDIKFYVEKFYMQEIPLLDIIEMLKNDSDLNGKIRVVKRSEFQHYENEECIWLIIDRSISSDLKYPGENRYYICYKQLYINENPFHIFDEDKPGWINNVTIPHTLSGAMINIGKCGFSGTRQYSLVDPFVGSGTTFLETLKYKNIVFEGGDICGLSQIIAKTNLSFFSYSCKDVDDLETLVLSYIANVDSNLYKEIADDIKTIPTEPKKDHNVAVIKLQSSLLDMERSFIASEIEFTKSFDDMTQKLKEELKKHYKKNKRIIDDIANIWIFSIWKFYKRHEYIYKTSNYEENMLISNSISEFKGLFYRLHSYRSLRKRNDNIINSSNSDDKVLTYYGKYSRGCSIDYKFLRDSIESSIERIHSNIDVLEFLAQHKDKKVDLIITDPPYGFNTIEDKKEFSKLYISFINAMVECISNGGQIIMCLPAVSYSGKSVNVFTQKEIVYQQFALAARKNKMYIVEKKENLPEPRQLYSFPFYWDSEKALRRDIIRLQFFYEK